MNFAELSPVHKRSSPPPAQTPSMPTLGDVVACIAAEVSAPLTTALDRISHLTSSGRIDRASLRALRDEIDGARRTGMRAQQIARLARGQIHQSVERLELSQLLRVALAERTEVAFSGAAGSRQALATVEVMGDPSLIHTLFMAVADWSAHQAQASVEWRLDTKPWPVRARLVCRFAHRPADLALAEAPGPDNAAPQSHLDTLDWLLLQYTAHLAGVSVQRDDDAVQTQLTLEFLHTVHDTLEGATATDLAAPHAGLPLIAGSQVLVLAARRDARRQVREAMLGHDLFIDYVPSVDEASRYCDDGTPQVFIYESSFDSQALRALCKRLDHAHPSAALIEIEPMGNHCTMGSIGSGAAARIGADGLRQQLASVIVLELARRR